MSKSERITLILVAAKAGRLDVERAMWDYIDFELKKPVECMNDVAVEKAAILIKEFQLFVDSIDGDTP